MPTKKMSFAQAILEGQDICLERDPTTFLMGLGATDPKGIFGTTQDLHKKYGKDRVFDTPVAENGLTGLAIGAAISGLRPVLTHQRVDFALLSLDQIFNNAAKWHYMFAGKFNVPLTIRMVMGRGWGQGPQHSQHLQALFAHMPGLKVIMPATPTDAKGMIISAIEDNNPVICLEHRWVHYLEGDVPEGYHKEPIGVSKIVHPGGDATIAATSYMVFEATRAAEVMKRTMNIDVEVIDLRTIKPLDKDTLVNSVTKTGHFISVDTGFPFCGVGSELITTVVENCFDKLKKVPVRVHSPDIPSPTTQALTKYYYPRSSDIARTTLKTLGLFDSPDANKCIEELISIESKTPHDVPDKMFSGPF